MQVPTLPLQSTQPPRLCPAPCPNPTAQASRALLLWASAGAAAPLMRNMESSWSFKGGTVREDNRISSIPSRYAQPHQGPSWRVWLLVAGFHPGPSHVLLAEVFMTRRTGTMKLATGLGPAHTASIASFTQPWVLSAVLVTRVQGHLCSQGVSP